MWFLNDLGLLNRERDAVRALEEANTWLDGVQWHLDTGMVIDAEIVVGTERRVVRLRFPIHYPSSPPSVRPKKPALWSSHQYGPNGDLCLELGPDNWHPNVHTAANMLESTYRLLTLEAEHSLDTDTQIPSRHALTDGQKHRFEVFRWIVTPTTLDSLDSVPDGQVAHCMIYFVYHEQTLTAFLKTIEFADGENWTDAYIPESLKRLGRSVQGIIINEYHGTLTSGKLDSPDSLTSILKALPIPASPNDDYNANLEDIQFVIFKTVDGLWQAHWRWNRGKKVSAFSRLETDATEPEARHGLDMNVLRDTTVAIVGLGSAGSKVVASLARSGVGHFVLLDDDLLHPGNLVRHDSDWSEVGQHKVDAMAERITLINPKATVERRLHRLNGQESSASAAAALSALSRADVIIDATANPNVFNLCAHMALDAKKTLLWLEIYAGGIGGLIARARPDKDPQPFTLRSAIIEAANAIANEKGVEPSDTAIDYGMLGEDDRIVMASDADVTVIAAQTTQMALDALLSREPSHYPHPAYLVGFARGWIFEQPFHTLPIDCTAEVDWSTVLDTDKTTRDESTAFILKLLEEHKNDADAKPAR